MKVKEKLMNEEKGLIKKKCNSLKVKFQKFNKDINKILKPQFYYEISKKVNQFKK